MTCSQCKFAVPHPSPGKEPHDPRKAKPEWLHRIFGFHYIFTDHFCWSEEKYRHENLIKCQRFPRRITMRKSETCGEFRIALDLKETSE